MVWFLGDNFLTKSFRSHYKLFSPSNQKHFVKENFEFAAVCNSSFSSANTNMLARIQNAFVSKLNSKPYTAGCRPAYVIVVLDDDLIVYLNHKSSDGVATLFGNWMEWLVTQISDALKTRASQLPKKCKIQPFIYWVTAPTHHFFSKERNNLRIKFNLSLESIVKQQENMRVIKLKEFWDTKDSMLVINDRITEVGMNVYWNAIDASVKYNITRCEQFVAKNVASSSSHLRDQSGISSVKQEKLDPMISFFNRHSTQRNVHAVSHRDSREDQLRFEDQRRFRDDTDHCRYRVRENDRFFLPCLWTDHQF